MGAAPGTQNLFQKLRLRHPPQNSWRKIKPAPLKDGQRVRCPLTLGVSGPTDKPTYRNDIGYNPVLERATRRYRAQNRWTMEAG